jgi:DNA polymerase III epsilon subunit-like protein
MNETIVYFDLETGGLEIHHPIIQLAAVAVAPDGTELDSFDARIKFNVGDCDPEALKINHYTEAAWANAIGPAKAAAMFAGWLNRFKWVTQVSKRTGKAYTVARMGGYNAATFDMPMLMAFFRKLNVFLPAHPRPLDVLQLADWYFQINPDQKDGLENTKLESVCKALGVPIPEGAAHDALVDVRYTAKLAQVLKERMGYKVKELISG